MVYASGGMVSTMADYRRFTQMLLNGGTFEGKTYLKPETFKLMTTDQVGPGSGVERDHFDFPEWLRIRAWACGADPSRQRQTTAAGIIGRIEMDGASGCYFVVDPKQDMFFVLLVWTAGDRKPRSGRPQQRRGAMRRL